MCDWEGEESLWENREGCNSDDHKRFRYTFEVPVWKCYWDYVEVYADSIEEARDKLANNEFDWSSDCAPEDWFDMKVEFGKAEFSSRRENLYD